MSNYSSPQHKDLFVFLKAEEVHPHDHFMNRVFLHWIPQTVTPNHFTILRIIFTPFVFLLVLYGYYRLGVSLFVLTAFTDAIDGSLARTRNQITRFGILCDPLADKFLIGSMVLLLVFRYLNFWLGIAVLGLEVASITTAFIAKVKFKDIRMANLWGKIKMIFQVLAVFAILMALVFNDTYLFTIATWLFGLAIGSALISLFRRGI